MYLVMLDDRSADERLRHQRRGSRRQTEEEQAAEKGFASSMSPESRQAVIQMIDHIVTPMLVDQWRYSPQQVPCITAALRAHHSSFRKPSLRAIAVFATDWAW